MIIFRTTFAVMLLLLQVSFCFVSPTVFGNPSKVNQWYLSGIIHDFEGSPNQQVYRMGPPEVRQLDATGGELIFRVTPVSDPGCTQVFRIGWKFDRNISNLREGESISVQLFNQPAGDGGIGFKQCYQQAKQRAYDGGFLTLGFHPSGANSLFSRPGYGKYHGGSAQYMFTKTTNVRTVIPIPYSGAPHVQYALDGFFVQDSPYRNKPGYMDAHHGAISFHISKGGMFKYNVSYLYDARMTPSVSGGSSVSGGDVLGRLWNETESGWQGVWTRRGNSNIFDARWGSGTRIVTAVMTINVTGNQVTIARRNSSDGNDCDYTGTIAPDGVSVQGTYRCTRYSGPFVWKASIVR